MTLSTGVGTFEGSITENLLLVLTGILEKYTGQGVRPFMRCHIPDGTIRKIGQDYTVPLLVMEYNQALSEEGCDPLTQASYSAWECWRGECLGVVGLRTPRF